MELSDQEASIEKLDNLSMRTERDATILSSSKAEQSTIVIRRVRFGERHDRSPETLVHATLASLKSMDSAIVQGPKDFAHGLYGGVQYDLSYTPPAGGGSTYQRRHVLLFGRTYAYHLIHTAPDGQLGEFANEFSEVVDSFREES
jgi:hypothetical protein